MPYDEYFEDRCIDLAERMIDRQKELERKCEEAEEMQIDEEWEEWLEYTERRIGNFFNWVTDNPFENFYRGSKYPFPFSINSFYCIDIYHDQFVPEEVTDELDEWLRAKGGYKQFLKVKGRNIIESAKIDYLAAKFLRQFGKTTEEQMQTIWDNGKHELPMFQREAFVKYTKENKNTIMDEFVEIIKTRVYAKLHPEIIHPFNLL